MPTLQRGKVLRLPPTGPIRRDTKKICRQYQLNEKRVYSILRKNVWDPFKGSCPEWEIPGKFLGLEGRYSPSLPVALNFLPHHKALQLQIFLITSF